MSILKESTLCDPVDCSPPGSSIHGLLQARTLQWVAIPFSGGSSPPRGQTRISCIGRRVLSCLSHQGRRIKMGSQRFKDLLSQLSFLLSAHRVAHVVTQQPRVRSILRPISWFRETTINENKKLTHQLFYEQCVLCRVP